jgi:hypothetical protein
MPVRIRGRLLEAPGVEAGEPVGASAGSGLRTELTADRGGEDHVSFAQRKVMDLPRSRGRAGRSPWWRANLDAVHRFVGAERQASRTSASSGGRSRYHRCASYSRRGHRKPRARGLVTLAAAVEALAPLAWGSSKRRRRRPPRASWKRVAAHPGRRGVAGGAVRARRPRAVSPAPAGDAVTPGSVAAHHAPLRAPIARATATPPHPRPIAPRNVAGAFESLPGLLLRSSTTGRSLAGRWPGGWASGGRTSSPRSGGSSPRALSWPRVAAGPRGSAGPPQETRLDDPPSARGPRPARRAAGVPRPAHLAPVAGVRLRRLRDCWTSWTN